MELNVFDGKTELREEEGLGEEQVFLDYPNGLEKQAMGRSG